MRIVESFLIQHNVRNSLIYIQLVKQLVPESAYLMKYWAKTDLKCLKSSKNPPSYEGMSHHSSIRELLYCPMSMVVHIFYSIWELLEIPRVILSCTHVVLKLGNSYFSQASRAKNKVSRNFDVPYHNTISITEWSPKFSPYHSCKSNAF